MNTKLVINYLCALSMLLLCAGNIFGMVSEEERQRLVIGKFVDAVQKKDLSALKQLVAQWNTGLQDFLIPINMVLEVDVRHPETTKEQFSITLYQGTLLHLIAFFGLTDFARFLIDEKGFTQLLPVKAEIRLRGDVDLKKLGFEGALWKTEKINGQEIRFWSLMVDPAELARRFAQRTWNPKLNVQEITDYLMRKKKELAKKGVQELPQQTRGKAMKEWVQQEDVVTGRRMAR